MNDQAFAVSARPRPSVILRVPLLDYSLGHELLLLNEANALLFQKEDFDALAGEEQRRALIRAVQICGRTWEGNKKPDKWLRVWGWFLSGTDWPLEIADFRNYRMDGSTFPRPREEELFPEESSGGRKLGSPHLSRLAAFACECFGESAFDMPLGFLQWMYFADAEREGAVSIENDFERQVREEVAKHQEDYAREQSEKKAGGA